MKKIVSLLGAGVISCTHVSSLDSLIEESWNATIENKTITIDKEGNTYENKGTGYIDGCLYKTVNHVVDHNSTATMTPFGMIEIPYEKKVEKTYVENVELEEVVKDKENDVAIFRLPKELCDKIGNKGFKDSNEVKIGMEVHIVGNPSLTGKTYRKTYVSRLEPPIETMPDYEGTFGLGVPCIGGDSGSRVFNNTNETIGLVRASAAGVCYVQRISYWNEHGIR